MVIATEKAPTTEIPLEDREWAIKQLQKRRARNQRYHKSHRSEIAEKHHQYNRTYYPGHKGERLDYGHSYYQKNRTEMLEQQHQYYTEHKEERNEYHKNLYQRHRGEILEYMRRYYATHKERKKTYHKEHPEVARADRRKRRAAMSGSKGTFTEEEFRTKCKEFDNRCTYCGQESPQLEPDHAIPLSRGGPNTIENIVPACAYCNSHKHSMTAEEYFAQLDKQKAGTEREHIHYSQTPS